MSARAAATDAPYQASPTRRPRRTKAEMGRLREALVRIVEAEKPTTVRHVFYRAVAAGIVPKTEGAYNNDVVRLLTQLRRGGEIPYESISDNTRWVLKSRTYGSAREAIDDFARTYRRDLWASRDVRVEAWAEKDAIAGLVSGVADPWCVPTMVFRGYSSVSYLHSLAEEIRACGRPTFIYYVGDYDPSGVDIERFVVKTVREMAPEAEINVRRLAVTAQQIKELRLPTRPTKRTDSRAAAFGRRRSVEVDAVDPRHLEDLLERAILQHLDPGEVDRLRRIEEQERESFEKFALRFKRLRQ